jgi:hypothetical protein
VAGRARRAAGSAVQGQWPLEVRRRRPYWRQTAVLNPAPITEATLATSLKTEASTKTEEGRRRRSDVPAPRYSLGVAKKIARRLAFSGWQPIHQDQDFNRIAAARQMAALGGENCILRHDNVLTTVEVADAGSDDKPTRLVLMALHDAETSPNAWQAGSPPATITLADGQYAAFVTHVCLWEHGVAVNDAWGSAPGLGRLSKFIAKRTDQRVLFRRLYHPSVADQLDDLDGWRSVDFTIHDEYKQHRATAKGLFSKLGASELPQVPSIRVSIGMGRKGPGDAYLPEHLVDQFLRMTDQADEFFDSLVIRGKSKTKKTRTGRPRTVEINMLSQRLQVPAELTADSRATNLPARQSVWSGFTKAHDELKEAGTLARALEMRLGISMLDS